jgi:hypothetical protein
LNATTRSATTLQRSQDIVQTHPPPARGQGARLSLCLFVGFWSHGVSNLALVS